MSHFKHLPYCCSFLPNSSFFVPKKSTKSSKLIYVFLALSYKKLTCPKACITAEAQISSLPFASGLGRFRPNFATSSVLNSKYSAFNSLTQNLVVNAVMVFTRYWSFCFSVGVGIGCLFYFDGCLDV